jgi:hypothetical protein
MPSNSPVRPFSDAYLLAYSEEHVLYEFDMFLWLAQVFGSKEKLRVPPAVFDAWLSNVLIESFVVHLRNVIDFLYPVKPKHTDIVAANFFDPGALKLPEISETLKTARVRANKEIAHLTTDRITGNPPKKVWNIKSIVNEVWPLLNLFAEKALATRLSPRVSAVIAAGQPL